MEGTIKILDWTAIGGCVAVFALVYTMLRNIRLDLKENFKSMDARFDKVDGTFKEVRKEMKDGFDEVRKEMKDGFDKVDARLEKIELKMDNGFKEVTGRIGRLEVQVGKLEKGEEERFRNEVKLFVMDRNSKHPEEK